MEGGGKSLTLDEDPGGLTDGDSEDEDGICLTPPPKSPTPPPKTDEGKGANSAKDAAWLKLSKQLNTPEEIYERERLQEARRGWTEDGDPGQQLSR